MTPDIVAVKLEPIIKNVIELVERNNDDELLGRLVVLNNKIQENKDAAAMVELSLIAFVGEYNIKEK